MTKPRFSISWLFAASIVFFVLGWFLSPSRDEYGIVVGTGHNVLKWNKKTGEVWYSVGIGDWNKYPQPHESQKE